MQPSTAEQLVSYRTLLKMHSPVIELTKWSKREYWQSGKEDHDIREYEVAPIFKSYVMQYTLPKFIYSDELGRTPFGGLPGEKRPGAMAGERVQIYYNQVEPSTFTDTMFVPGVHDFLRTGIERTRWYMMASLFVGPPDGLPKIAKTWAYLLGDDGYVLRASPEVRRRYNLQDEKGNVGEEFYFFAMSRHASSVVDRGLISFLNCGSLAHHFTHSVNVDLKEIPAPKSKGKSKSRNRKQVQPKVKYHTIRIKPMSKKRLPIAETLPRNRRERNERIKRLFKRRGRWRHYGPEYGRGLLFGKYAGRFYDPEYTYDPGEDQEGVNISDYELE